MRGLKGVGILNIEILQVAASNPNCLPSYTVSWSPNLSETYQLERSINGGAWAIIYTGTALSFAQNSLSEAIYSYRVKVVGEADYSNTASVTVKTQNLVTFEGCLNPNVAPYTYRVTTRTNCGTFTNVDTNNDTRCGYVAGICPGTTNTIIDPPNLEPGVSYHYTIELGFITATKICAEIECLDDGNRTPTWGIYFDDIGDDYITFGNVSGHIGDKAVYSASVSLNGSRNILIWVSAYGETGAGKGVQRINKASWG